MFISLSLSSRCLRSNVRAVNSGGLQALRQGFLRLLRLLQPHQNGFECLRNRVFVIGIHAISGKLR